MSQKSDLVRQLLTHFFTIHHRPQELGGWVGSRAIGPDLPLVTGQHAQLAHLDHGVHEVFKEERLVDGEALHGSLGPRVDVHVLVRGEEPLPVHEVDVVLVVEGVRGSDVVDGGVYRGVGRAGKVEVLGEGLVHGGVLGGEQAVVEGGAMRKADGVAAGERDEVVGIEANVVEHFEEFRDVGPGGREAGEDLVRRGGGEAVAPALRHLVVGAAGL